MNAPDLDGDAAASHRLQRVAALWPALADRLGARQGTFLDAAAAQAVRRGLEGADAARYVNLCCAFGPAFEERPENEWALAVLIDERLSGTVKVHQL